MTTEVIDTDRNQAQIDALHQALSQGRYVQVRNMLTQMPACDVALVLESVPPKTRTILWQLLDPDAHGEILEELSEDVRKGIMKNMVPETLAAAAEDMDSDDLAEVLRDLPDNIYQQVLMSMDEQNRQRAEQAMAYPPETAGSIMNTDVITVRADVNVDVVLRYLRMKGELPEGTDQLYVVEENDRYIGTVSLATLVTSPPDTPVSEVMDKDEVIPVDMPENEVAQLFERHDWISAPVVDAEGRLLGRITIDDVVDIIREQSEHSMMSMAGLDDEEDTFAPVLKSTRKRTTWLFINLITALLAAAVSAQFEAILDKVTILAILNTIVPSMGGVAGNQTLTLVIRGMALGHIGSANTRWLLTKELAIGVLNGILWAVMIATVVVLAWQTPIQVGIVIAIAMMANMIAAGVAGVVVPLLLKRFNIDPALAGGVVLTTITDVVGIFAFLGTATLLLG